MRQLVLSPRWIMWHLLTLGAMATCGWLAVWQWQRAGSAMGSALNVGYGLQWPLFALFFAGLWWRMLRLEAAELKGRPPGVDEAVAEQPASAPAEPEPEPRPDIPPVDPGPSPFGPRPASARVAVNDEDDPELAAYNRMLAQLAAQYPDD